MNNVANGAKRADICIYTKETIGHISDGSLLLWQSCLRRLFASKVCYMDDCLPWDLTINSRLWRKTSLMMSFIPQK